MVAFILVLILLFLVIWAISSPWRRSRGAVPHHKTDDRARQSAAYVLDLEAARDAKYREIRDAELDNQTGKLSDSDFSAVDATLRAEAVGILRDLDRAQKRLEKMRRDEETERTGRAAAPPGLEAERDAVLERDREANASASSADAE